jgi:hypothetical protein
MPKIWDALKVGFKLFLIALLNALIWKLITIAGAALFATGVVVFGLAAGVGLLVVELLVAIPLCLIVNGWLILKFKKWIFK